MFFSLEIKKFFGNKENIYFSNQKNDKNTCFESLDKNYNYNELLDRLIKILNKNNIETVSNHRLTLQPPKIGREGTKKTIFLNFEKICKKLNRERDHLFLYISNELGTSASIQEGGGLVLKGRFQPKGIENILKNYIKEYVLCGSCGRAKTELKKDLETRLIFLCCQVCGAWRSVNQIRAGFIAQTKRRKN